MAMIRPQRLWMLFLYAGAVLAAATVATTSLGPQEPSAPVAAADATTEGTISPKGDFDQLCGSPTSVAVEAVSGAPGGWSYFGTGSTVSLGGAVTYFCFGHPYHNGAFPETHFWAGVTCDGSLLNVNFQEVVAEDWTASFTAPSNESVCSLELHADANGGASAVVNETLVFMADPALRPTVTLTGPQAGVLIYPDTVQLRAEASAAQPETIVKVEFWDQSGPGLAGQIKLGEVTAAPYVLSDVALDPAEHWITAVATVSREYKVISEPTQVSSRFNLAPVVKVLSPTVGAVFAQTDSRRTSATKATPRGR